MSLLFSGQTLEGCEILLGPEVTYGASGLDLFSPVAMTIAHCAEVDAENWNIQLKRKTQDGKWEVSRRLNTCQPHYSASNLNLAQCHLVRIAYLFFCSSFFFVAECQSQTDKSDRSVSSLCLLWLNVLSVPYLHSVFQLGHVKATPTFSMGSLRFMIKPYKGSLFKPK